MKTQELAIQGMHCDHCVMAVRRELSKLPKVLVEEVKIGTARVRYDEEAVGQNDFAKAIEDAGYALVE